MPCTHCTTASTQRHWGGFNANCLDCAARLVASTHPNKQQAKTMLAVICRRPGRPSADEILSRVTQMLAKQV